MLVLEKVSIGTIVYRDQYKKKKKLIHLTFVQRIFLHRLLEKRRQPFLLFLSLMGAFFKSEDSGLLQNYQIPAAVIYLLQF